MGVCGGVWVCGGVRAFLRSKRLDHEASDGRANGQRMERQWLDGGAVPTFVCTDLRIPRTASLWAARVLNEIRIEMLQNNNPQRCR